MRAALWRVDGARREIEGTGDEFPRAAAGPWGCAGGFSRPARQGIAAAIPRVLWRDGLGPDVARAMGGSNAGPLHSLIPKTPSTLMENVDGADIPAAAANGFLC